MYAKKWENKKEMKKYKMVQKQNTIAKINFYYFK